MLKRILLIDDEPALLFAIEKYLDRCGYEVDCAAELAGARALLNSVAYDVVITDMRLTAATPDDGLQVIRFIRENSLAARVVVLTGAAGHETEAEARRLGIDRFLHKPLPLAELAGIVAELTA